EGDDEVSFIKADTDHARGGSSHRSRVAFLEANCHALVGDEDDVAVPIGLAHPNQLVVVVEPDGDQAVGTHRLELIEADALDAPELRREEEVVLRVEFLDVQERRHRLVRLHVDDIDDRQTLGGASGVWQLVNLDLVHATPVREHEEGVHRVRAQDVMDLVLLAGGDAALATSASALELVHLIGDALDVALLGNRDENVNLGNQVLLGENARDILDAGAAGVAEALLEVGEVVLDEAEDLLRIRKQALEVLDFLEDFLVLVLDLLALESSQASETHVQDGLGLRVGQLEARHQVLLRRVLRPGAPDGVDDLVDVVERDLQAFEDVGATASTVELEFRASGNDLDPVVDVFLQRALQRQDTRLRALLDEREHVDAECLLEGSVLEEVVEHLHRLRVALELDDNAHARAVRFVAQAANAVQLALTDH